MIQVMATQKGYYGEKRRNEGEVFEIKDEDFSERWMKKTQVSKSVSLRSKPAKDQTAYDSRDLVHALASTAVDESVKAEYESQPDAGKDLGEEPEEQQEQPKEGAVSRMIRKGKHALKGSSDEESKEPKNDGNKEVI